MKIFFDQAVTGLMVCLIGAIALPDCQAQNWRTGDDFQKAVGDPGLRISWQSAPLAKELKVACDALGLAVVVDRRIDPGQLITIQVDDISFEQLLWRIADKNHAAVVRLDNTLYVGPELFATQLQSTVDELADHMDKRHLPAAVRRSLSTKTNFVVEEPFEPATEIQALFNQHNLEVRGLELIPHDLWAPINWPEMQLGQLLNILLAGFDLKLAAVDKDRLEIVHVKLPDTVSYVLSSAQINGLDSDWLKEMKGITVKKTDRKWRLAGEPADIVEAIRAIANQTGATAQDRPPGRAVLSLHTSARRGDIVATIAAHLSLQTKISPECQTGLGQIVEVQVKDASPEDILRAALNDSNLDFRITDSAIEILPKKCP